MFLPRKEVGGGGGGGGGSRNCSRKKEKILKWVRGRVSVCVCVRAGACGEEEKWVGKSTEFLIVRLKDT